MGGDCLRGFFVCGSDEMHFASLGALFAQHGHEILAQRKRRGVDWRGARDRVLEGRATDKQTRNRGQQSERAMEEAEGDSFHEEIGAQERMVHVDRQRRVGLRAARAFLAQFVGLQNGTFFRAPKDQIRRALSSGIGYWGRPYTVIPK
jgi:hypothetical protein